VPDPQTTSDLPPLPSPDRLQALLHEAARIGRDDVIPALLQAGASMEGRDPKGFTPLILASYNGHAATTGLLLDLGADPAGADEARGNTALMGVAFKGYSDIARALLNAGAEANQRNDAGQTALMNAVMFGHDTIMEMLLAAGADPQATDIAGNSPVSLAAAQGNSAMVDRIRRATLDAIG
jgi:ankyrin repeat protein